MLRLRSSHPKGVADLLNYAALVGERIILPKDGTFLAAWSYSGPDMGSASYEELAVLSSQVNSALARHGDCWMLHADAIRQPERRVSRGRAFPDPTTRLFDKKRRGQYVAEGAHYESRYCLALTYRPPADVEARLSVLFFEGDREIHGLNCQPCVDSEPSSGNGRACPRPQGRWQGVDRRLRPTRAEGVP